MAQLSNFNITSQPKQSLCNQCGDVRSKHPLAVVFSMCWVISLLVFNVWVSTTHNTPFRITSLGNDSVFSVLTVEFSSDSWSARSVWPTEDEPSTFYVTQVSLTLMKVFLTGLFWICCGPCGSWRGVQQLERPSGRAPLTARWHKPLGPADGRCPLAHWSWCLGHQASADRPAVVQGWCLLPQCPALWRA